MKAPVYLISTILLVAVVIIACNGKGPEPDDPVKIIDGPDYFPMNDGDTWYYNSGNIIREVDGDTTVNGVSCKRVLTGGQADQGWTVTNERFAQHLFDGVLYFDPPLEIPFSLEKGRAHSFSSLGKINDEHLPLIDSLRTIGTLTFDGYVQWMVNNVEVDSCLKLDYKYKDFVYFKGGTVEEDSSAYSEIWGKGIGLIDDGDLHLDLANINGVDVPTE